MPGLPRACFAACDGAVIRRRAKGESQRPASSARRLNQPRASSAASLFSVSSPLGLFNRQIGCHLIDPRRHPVGQSPFNGEIGRKPRLPRGKFGRLLFGPLLRGGKLHLERFDMGFKRSDDLTGERSFIRIAGALSAAIDPNAVVPTLWRPDPRTLVVSECLLPLAAPGPLADRLGRHAQQVRRLPVGKPLARQIVPRQ